MFEIMVGESRISLGLVVVDMQNGFVAKDGLYDKLGMNTPLYREIIPRVRQLIDSCKSFGIPVFFTEAVREASGIDSSYQSSYPVTKVKRGEVENSYMR